MMRTLALIALVLSPLFALAAAPHVTAVRCPDGGVQPQSAVDASGKVHLIYLKGDDAKSDVYYTTSTDGGRTWAKAIRVNSHPGSAIAVGTVRGAQLALGKGNRPHVAWMGSQVAEPRGPGGATPMLYARPNDAGDAFEPQRNLITSAPGLDGGGSVIADASGNVIVAWHAPVPGQKGEANRTVWAAASRDDGKTFAPERRLSDDATGACGCCGMRLGLDSSGDLLALYRAANPSTRDVYLLHPGRGANSKFTATKLHEWPTKTCPMSTMAFATTPQTTLAAWETSGQVYFTAWDAGMQRAGEPVAPPGKGVGRKHPSIATNTAGLTLLAWAEGTGWKRGGSLAWQVFDGDHKPLAEARGGAKDLPAWSLPTVTAAPDGTFLIVY